RDAAVVVAVGHHEHGGDPGPAERDGRVGGSHAGSDERLQVAVWIELLQRGLPRRDGRAAVCGQCGANGGERGEQGFAVPTRGDEPGQGAVHEPLRKGAQRRRHDREAGVDRRRQRVAVGLG
ncbi:MAG: hypothetical protein ACK55I_42225, partial [bacterium]